MKSRSVFATLAVEAARISMMRGFAMGVRGGQARVWVGAAAVSAFAVLVAVAAGASSKADRSVMRENFLALSTAYSMSLDEDVYAAEENRKSIRMALQSLAENAAALEAHGNEKNLASAFLRESLSRDARAALNTYENGRYRESRFVLNQMIDNCVGCHSKLPSASGFEQGGEFIGGITAMLRSLDERVRLVAATGQFDAALASYGVLFRFSIISPQEIDLLGAFQGYFEITIQVRADFSRPLKTLKSFSQRDDLHGYLKNQVSAWISALEELSRQGGPGEGLGSAKLLIQEARMRSVFPEDPNALVYYVAAAGVLHRFVDAGVEDKQELAEAFYLLGVTESHVSHSYWISETEYYLETSIRLAPKAEFAKRAFSFLEELTTAGFTGSAGVNVPRDEARRLAELRALVYGP